MSRRDKLLFHLGRLLAVIALGFWIWLLLPIASWYVKHIPDKTKKIPYVEWLRTYERRFYDWLSEFLKTWLLSSVGITIGSWILMASVALVDEFVLHRLGFLYDSPLKVVLFLYLTFVVGTGYLGFSSAKSICWDALFWQAEPAARLLVGEEEYKKLTEPQKEELKRYVVDAEIGVNKGAWVVRGGKTQTIRPPSGSLAKFGGPGILIVQTGHAIVLERKGNQFRIAGEGFHRLQSFERPEMVIPLNTQAAKLKVKNVITKDGAVIDEFDALVFHKMESGRKTRDTSGRYPFDENMIWTAWDTKGDNPGDSVKAIAETVVRTIVAKHTLEDLFVGHDIAREKLREELIEETNKITSPFIGITVIAAAIDDIVLPEVTKQKLWQTWATERDAAMLRSMSTTEAQVLDLLEKTRNIARQDLLEKIRMGISATAGALPPDLAKQLLEMVEKLSQETVTEDVTSKRQLELLRQLIESDAQKNIYVGTPPMVGFGRRTSG